ncbi:hypothetical protein A6V39_02750 [Candidatus Mycoplasma haematobovis]|uniref:DUF31 domain-containing protein n=1 Tax=Candidatus Mycoplasma haematobovis TaxID=432608 RepID=A0A1A9QCZ8_9MOLU|nr:hypothetical protein [Candidatus Mycoplasma haematobovis]OAL10333.1 hypothetical protein A6V39_02750 [Candidatus Mycoplasma haematobovis]
MPVNLKVLGAGILTVSTAFIALKQSGSESVLVESTKSAPTKDVSNVDTIGPHPEIQNSYDSNPLSLQLGSTWEPSPVNYTGEITESYDWGVGYTKEDKERNREVANKVLGTLEDYTFKLFLPCTVGTGWILDYEIPKDPNQYPTKWYIATASHVIQRLSFSENPYGQLLPKRHEWAKTARQKKQTYIDSISDPNYEVRRNCQASHDLGYFDMNISQEKTWEAGRRADIGGGG